jgi:hypothetical protein
MRQRDIRETIVDDGGRRQRRTEKSVFVMLAGGEGEAEQRRQADQTLLIPKNVPATPTI